MLMQRLVEGLAAVGLRNFRHRGVERIAGEVEMQTLRQNGQRLGFVDLHPALQQRELLLGLLVGFADDRHHARKDGELVRLAAVFGHPLLERVVVGLRELGVAVDHGENHVGDPRRQFLTGRRAAGLDDDRMALRAALDVERPLDRKESSFVIELADLALVEELAGLLVGDDRAVVPGIPKAAHDIDEFARRSRSAGRGP